MSPNYPIKVKVNWVIKRQCLVITHHMSLFYPKRRGNKETVISQYIAGTKGNTLKSLTGIKNILPTLTIPTCTTSKCPDFMQVYERFVKFIP